MLNAVKISSANAPLLLNCGSVIKSLKTESSRER